MEKPNKLTGIFCLHNLQLKHLDNPEMLENLLGKLPAVDCRGRELLIINSNWKIRDVDQSNATGISLQSPQGEIRDINHKNGGFLQREILLVITWSSWAEYDLHLAQEEIGGARAETASYLEQRNIAEQAMREAREEIIRLTLALQQVFDLEAQSLSRPNRQQVLHLIEEAGIKACDKCHLAACSCPNPKDVE